MEELTFKSSLIFDQNVYFFWPTGCEIIVNTINFYIDILFKTLKRLNSQVHKKTSKSSNITMNNIFWYLLY